MIFRFFFKQKTAYERRISDWSSDVCSSDLEEILHCRPGAGAGDGEARQDIARRRRDDAGGAVVGPPGELVEHPDEEELRDRKSVVWGKSVSVLVDIGGSRIINKKTINNKI